MVSDEVVKDGLAALSVAAAELVEDHHEELVTILPASVEVGTARMERLQELGADLMALGEAGLVLLKHASGEQSQQ